MSESTIVSFVLRFTRDDAAEATATGGWRGVIRHVQTNDEIHFLHFTDALTFMERYMGAGTAMIVGRQAEDTDGVDP